MGMFIILIVLMIFTCVFICQKLLNCRLYVGFAFNYTSIKLFLNIWGKKIFLPAFLNQVWRNLNFMLVGYEPLIVVSFIRLIHFSREPRSAKSCSLNP